MSIWNLNINKRNIKELKEDKKVDILIIGAGITGLTSAYYLKNKNVCVVDANLIGHGVTLNSTAKINYFQQCVYTKIKNSTNSLNAITYLKSQKYAIDCLKEIIEKEKINCDLKRVSDGEGVIWEKTLDELKKYDFGSKFSKQFEGLRIVTFEEILKKYSCHVVMNIHVKTKTETDVFDDSIIEKIVSLIRKYDCEKYVYFMTGNKNLQKQLARLAPHIPRCMGENSEHWKIVDNAIELGCAKVQLFKPYFNKEMIEKAHAHGIKCNVFWSDDVEEAKDFLKMEIDTILTNDYLKISKIL